MTFGASPCPSKQNTGFSCLPTQKAEQGGKVNAEHSVSDVVVPGDHLLLQDPDVALGDVSADGLLNRGDKWT